MIRCIECDDASKPLNESGFCSDDCQWLFDEKLQIQRQEGNDS